MIFRPHFTYIRTVTPEQTQAREAAANEEWRKKVIFHPVVRVHITPEPIVRPPIRIIRLINIKPIQEQATPEPVHVVRTVNEPKERMQVRYGRPISLFVPSNDNNEPTFTVPRRIFIPSESEETEKKVERLIPRYKSPLHASPVFWTPKNTKNETNTSRRTTTLGRTLSALEQSEGISTSPPPQQ